MIGAGAIGSTPGFEPGDWTFESSAPSQDRARDRAAMNRSFKPARHVRLVPGAPRFGRFSSVAEPAPRKRETPVRFWQAAPSHGDVSVTLARLIVTQPEWVELPHAAPMLAPVVVRSLPRSEVLRACTAVSKTAGLGSSPSTGAKFEGLAQSLPCGALGESGRPRRPVTPKISPLTGRVVQRIRITLYERADGGSNPPAPSMLCRIVDQVLRGT